MTKEDITRIINNFLIEEFEINESKINPGAHLKDDLALKVLTSWILL